MRLTLRFCTIWATILSTSALAQALYNGTTSYNGIAYSVTNNDTTNGAVAYSGGVAGAGTGIVGGTSTGIGVEGFSGSSSGGTGVWGQSLGGVGVLGVGPSAGVWGDGASFGPGVKGTNYGASSIGIWGSTSGTTPNYGVRAESSTGQGLYVYAPGTAQPAAQITSYSSSASNVALNVTQTGPSNAINATSPAAITISATNSSTAGGTAMGAFSSGTSATLEAENLGTSGGNGVYAYSNYGMAVFATAARSNAIEGDCQSSAASGVYGSNTGGGYGVAGRASGTGVGIYGDNSSGNYSAVFNTPVVANGHIFKNGGGFWIDHPDDPANKYLYHSFVESPDMKNVYDGIVTLDQNGRGAVSLPTWFESLNGDFRYQLTCIGKNAPIYIETEIQNNQFTIAGGVSGLRVSWQVTGIRRDAFANAHRIPVEVDKQPSEVGRYQHPELYGHTAELQVMPVLPSGLATPPVFK